MFGLLKNKISSFISSIAGNAAKEEKRPEIEPQSLEPVAEEKSDVPKAMAPAEPQRHAHWHKHAEIPREAAREKAPEQENKLAPIARDGHQKPAHSIRDGKEQEERKAEPKFPTTPLPAPGQIIHHKQAETSKVVDAPAEIPKPIASAPEFIPPKIVPKAISEQEMPGRTREERDLGPKIGILDRVKSIFTNEVTIGEAEATPMFESLETALLESDVSYDTSMALVESLRGKIVGMKTGRGNVEAAVKGAVRQSFMELFSGNSFDLYNFIAASKAKGEPAVILMVGPNGAGKTTTIAKLASQLQARGFTSVIAAGDTFRKAAIEQAVIHGHKLGVRVVKHDYGADPTAVAFDAISAAKAGKLDVVLIDTAGRQETNANLVKEMQKMERVLHPDLKIFVGEAIAGNSLIGQIKAFHDAIRLDGIILTKLDCDAKGGGAFSIAYETKLPIIMVGVGQEYGDLRPFDAEWIVDNVFAA